ncbi:unnamed protein product [Prunus brigantina]
MGFPELILKALKAKGIIQPTPIQVQSLPMILPGRDMIGVVSTGSRKTLVFLLPLVMLACQAESMMPILSNEGPIGLIICPSRELAKHIYEVVEGFLTPMREARYLVISRYLTLDEVNRLVGFEDDIREAFDHFKGEKDVLVATDVVSKGLYFPDVEHVISYDMPTHVEDYG